MIYLATYLTASALLTTLVIALGLSRTRQQRAPLHRETVDGVHNLPTEGMK